MEQVSRVPEASAAVGGGWTREETRQVQCRARRQMQANADECSISLAGRRQMLKMRRRAQESALFRMDVGLARLVMGLGGEKRS